LKSQVHIRFIFLLRISLSLWSYQVGSKHEWASSLNWEVTNPWCIVGSQSGRVAWRESHILCAFLSRCAWWCLGKFPQHIHLDLFEKLQHLCLRWESLFLDSDFWFKSRISKLCPLYSLGLNDVVCQLSDLQYLQIVDMGECRTRTAFH